MSAYRDDGDPDGMLSSDELMEGEKRNQKRLFLRMCADFAFMAVGSLRKTSDPIIF